MNDKQSQQMLALVMTVALDETLKPSTRAVFSLMYGYPHKFSTDYMYMRYKGINAPIIDKNSREYKEVIEAFKELVNRGYVFNDHKTCEKGEEEYILNLESADFEIFEGI